MYPSSALCRAQEAYHRDRAAAALLDNVRSVAAKAAVAWSNVARVAERREARHPQARQAAGIMEAPTRRTRDEEDRSFSENPDRGFANG